MPSVQDGHQSESGTQSASIPKKVSIADTVSTADTVPSAAWDLVRTQNNYAFEPAADPAAQLKWAKGTPVRLVEEAAALICRTCSLDMKTVDEFLEKLGIKDACDKMIGAIGEEENDIVELADEVEDDARCDGVSKDEAEQKAEYYARALRLEAVEGFGRENVVRYEFDQSRKEPRDRLRGEYMKPFLKKLRKEDVFKQMLRCLTRPDERQISPGAEIDPEEDFRCKPLGWFFLVRQYLGSVVERFRYDFASRAELLDAVRRARMCVSLAVHVCDPAARATKDSLEACTNQVNGGDFRNAKKEYLRGATSTDGEMEGAFKFLGCLFENEDQEFPIVLTDMALGPLHDSDVEERTNSGSAFPGLKVLGKLEDFLLRARCHKKAERTHVMRGNFCEWMQLEGDAKPKEMFAIRDKDSRAKLYELMETMYLLGIPVPIEESTFFTFKLYLDFDLKLPDDPENPEQAFVPYENEILNKDHPLLQILGSAVLELFEPSDKRHRAVLLSGRSVDRLRFRIIFPEIVVDKNTAGKFLAFIRNRLVEEYEEGQDGGYFKFLHNFTPKGEKLDPSKFFAKFPTCPSHKPDRGSQNPSEKDAPISIPGIYCGDHGKGAQGHQKLDALSLPHSPDRPVLVLFKKNKGGPASIDLYSRYKAEKKLGGLRGIFRSHLPIPGGWNAVSEDYFFPPRKRFRVADDCPNSNSLWAKMTSIGTGSGPDLEEHDRNLYEKTKTSWIGDSTEELKKECGFHSQPGPDRRTRFGVRHKTAHGNEPSNAEKELGEAVRKDTELRAERNAEKEARRKDQQSRRKRKFGCGGGSSGV